MFEGDCRMTGGGTMVGFNEAVAMVLHEARGMARPRAQSVLLREARGRVLAAAIMADRAMPAFDRATRDGYAVRAADCGDLATLRVVGTVRAGEMWRGAAVGAGEAIEIMTGAPLPEGADAVVMVEHVEQQDGGVRLRAGKSASEGLHVVRAGSEAWAGQELMAAGTEMGPAQMALAAAVGAAEVRVYERPRVGILTTGDEVVGVGARPRVEQIRNSNAALLAALVEQSGGEAVVLEHARDEREAIAAGIRAAAGCEMLVVSGGVSAGQYDLVEEELERAGAKFFFTGVRMQPGRPVVFGRMASGQYVFGLPGNPVSTHVTFLTLVRPLLRAMCGMEMCAARMVMARMGEEMRGRAGLTRFLPAKLDDGMARLIATQGSGDMAADARADGYVVVAEDVERIETGDVVKMLLGEIC